MRAPRPPPSALAARVRPLAPLLTPCSAAAAAAAAAAVEAAAALVVHPHALRVEPVTPVQAQRHDLCGQLAPPGPHGSLRIVAEVVPHDLGLRHLPCVDAVGGQRPVGPHGHHSLLAGAVDWVVPREDEPLALAACKPPQRGPGWRRRVRAQPHLEELARRKALDAENGCLGGSPLVVPRHHSVAGPDSSNGHLRAVDKQHPHPRSEATLVVDTHPMHVEPVVGVQAKGHHLHAPRVGFVAAAGLRQSGGASQAPVAPELRLGGPPHPPHVRHADALRALALKLLADAERMGGQLVLLHRPVGMKGHQATHSPAPEGVVLRGMEEHMRQ